MAELLRQDAHRHRHRAVGQLVGTGQLEVAYLLLDHVVAALPGAFVDRDRRPGTAVGDELLLHGAQPHEGVALGEPLVLAPFGVGQFGHRVGEEEALGADELHDLLAANIPAEQAPAIVHGDYRLDNLLIENVNFRPQNATLNGPDQRPIYFYGYNGFFNSIDVNQTLIDPWGNTETFESIEAFRGSMYGDRFVGSGIDETFLGLGGNATLAAALRSALVANIAGKVEAEGPVTTDGVPGPGLMISPVPVTRLTR